MNNNERIFIKNLYFPILKIQYLINILKDYNNNDKNNNIYTKFDNKIKSIDNLLKSWKMNNLEVNELFKDVYLYLIKENNKKNLLGDNNIKSTWYNFLYKIISDFNFKGIWWYNEKWMKVSIDNKKQAIDFLNSLIIYNILNKISLYKLELNVKLDNIDNKDIQTIIYDIIKFSIHKRDNEKQILNININLKNIKKAKEIITILWKEYFINDIRNINEAIKDENNIIDIISIIWKEINNIIKVNNQENINNIIDEIMIDLYMQEKNNEIKEDNNIDNEMFWSLVKEKILNNDKYNNLIQYIYEILIDITKIDIIDYEKEKVNKNLNIIYNFLKKKEIQEEFIKNNNTKYLISLDIFKLYGIVLDISNNNVNDDIKKHYIENIIIKNFNSLFWDKSKIISYIQENIKVSKNNDFFYNMLNNILFIYYYLSKNNNINKSDILNILDKIYNIYEKDDVFMFNSILYPLISYEEKITKVMYNNSANEMISSKNYLDIRIDIIKSFINNHIWIKKYFYLTKILLYKNWWYENKKNHLIWKYINIKNLNIDDYDLLFNYMKTIWFNISKEEFKNKYKDFPAKKEELLYMLRYYYKIRRDTRNTAYKYVNLYNNIKEKWNIKKVYWYKNFNKELLGDESIYKVWDKYDKEKIIHIDNSQKINELTKKQIEDYTNTINELLRKLLKKEWKDIWLLQLLKQKILTLTNNEEIISPLNTLTNKDIDYADIKVQINNLIKENKLNNKNEQQLLKWLSNFIYWIRSELIKFLKNETLYNVNKKNFDIKNFNNKKLIKLREFHKRLLDKFEKIINENNLNKFSSYFEEIEWLETDKLENLFEEFYTNRLKTEIDFIKEHIDHQTNAINNNVSNNKDIITLELKYWNRQDVLENMIVWENTDCCVAFNSNVNYWLNIYDYMLSDNWNQIYIYDKDKNRVVAIIFLSLVKEEKWNKKYILIDNIEVWWNYKNIIQNENVKNQIKDYLIEFNKKMGFNWILQWKQFNDLLLWKNNFEREWLVFIGEKPTYTDSDLSNLLLVYNKNNNEE